MTRTKLALLIGAAAALFVFAACGEDTGNDEAPPPAASQPASSGPSSASGAARTPPPSPAPISTSSPTPIPTPTPTPEPTYSYEVVRTEPLVLRGDDVFEIVDTHFVMRADIELYDNAQLIIRDSYFEHRQEHSFQNMLWAYGDSSVRIERTRMDSDGFIQWVFKDRSSLTSIDLDDDQSFVWHLFTDDSRATYRSARFNGTVCDRSAADVEDSHDMEVELCFTDGITVDEALPAQINEYTFPNEGESGMDFTFTARNSSAGSWGISISANSDVVIRDVLTNLIVTFLIIPPWRDVEVELDGLRRGYYEDKTWELLDSRLRLINVMAGDFSPLVTEHNTLTIRDSDLADMVNHSGWANVIIENSVIGVVRAQEGVTITIRNSEVLGDVLAIDQGTVILENSTVGGQITELDEGRVLIDP